MNPDTPSLKRRSKPPLSFTIFRSPLGWCGVIADATAVCNIVLPAASPRDVRRRLLAIRPAENVQQAETPLLRIAARQLAQYLAGKRAHFAFPVLLPNPTPFQTAVYRAVSAIPYGSTASYAAIAAAVGKPPAARAVGRAMARNPLPLVVPCHRVLAANGALCGFSAQGGLLLKQRLLALEHSRSHKPGAIKKRRGRQRVAGTTRRVPARSLHT